MTESPVQCVWPLAAELGEGPLWQPAEQALYFVDIKAPAVHRCAADGSQRWTWRVPEAIGFIQPLAGRGFVCGLKGSLQRFNPQRGSLEQLLAVELGVPGNRLNDATVDLAGRLWFGSMDDGESLPSGSLYRVGPGAVLHTADTGICITNGPAVSPDGRTLHHTDTLKKRIHAFDLAPDGTLSNKRLLVEITGTGWPDGTTVDAEGCLWVALFGGGRVERYSPRGELLGAVALPCANVTKVAFGGDDLRTVLVTTARKGLSLNQQAAQPLAGGLFSFRSAVPGLAAPTITVGFPA